MPTTTIYQRRTGQCDRCTRPSTDPPGGLVLANSEQGERWLCEGCLLAELGAASLCTCPVCGSAITMIEGDTAYYGCGRWLGLPSQGRTLFVQRADRSMWDTRCSRCRVQRVAGPWSTARFVSAHGAGRCRLETAVSDHPQNRDPTIPSCRPTAHIPAPEHLRSPWHDRFVRIRIDRCRLRADLAPFEPADLADPADDGQGWICTHHEPEHASAGRAPISGIRHYGSPWFYACCDDGPHRDLDPRTRRWRGPDGSTHPVTLALVRARRVRTWRRPLWIVHETLTGNRETVSYLFTRRRAATAFYDRKLSHHRVISGTSPGPTQINRAMNG